MELIASAFNPSEWMNRTVASSVGALSRVMVVLVMV